MKKIAKNKKYRVVALISFLTTTFLIGIFFSKVIFTPIEVAEAVLDGVEFPESAYPNVARLISLKLRDVSSENTNEKDYNDYDKTFCTGTLIGSRYVLTAGHCLYDKFYKRMNFLNDQVRVRLNGVDYQSKTFYIHPSYGVDPLPQEIDAAIIELSSDVKNIRPATLNTTVTPIDTEITFAGYGRINDDYPPIKPGLGKIQVGENLIEGYGVHIGSINNLTLDLTKKGNYFYWMFDSGICESSLNLGDSGGPVFINTTLLAGINSYIAPKDGVCGLGTRTFATRVDKIIPWINGILSRKIQNSDSILGSEFLNPGSTRGIIPPSNKTLDIAIIGDDYTFAEMEKFRVDAGRMVAETLGIEPFHSRASQIMFHYVNNTQDLQCAYSGRSIFCNNAVANQVLRSANVPFDKKLIIYNHSDHGGEGKVEYAAVDNGEYGPIAAVHELGHHIGFLQDEYLADYTKSDFPIANSNCSTTATMPESWKGLVAPADYTKECSLSPNYYRSSPTSLMETLEVHYFNVISQKILNKQIDSYAGSYTNSISPTSQITSPQTNSRVSDVISVETDVNDDQGIARAELRIDGELAKTEYEQPFTFEFPSIKYPNGNHTLEVFAYDVAGNVGKSQLVSIIVNNPIEPGSLCNNTAEDTFIFKESLKLKLFDNNFYDYCADIAPHPNLDNSGRYDMNTWLGLYRDASVNAGFRGEAEDLRYVSGATVLKIKKQNSTDYIGQLKAVGTPEYYSTAGISGNTATIFKSDSNSSEASPSKLYEPGGYIIEAWYGDQKISSDDICLPSRLSPTGNKIGDVVCGEGANSGKVISGSSPSDSNDTETISFTASDPQQFSGTSTTYNEISMSGSLTPTIDGDDLLIEGTLTYAHKKSALPEIIKGGKLSIELVDGDGNKSKIVPYSVIQTTELAEYDTPYPFSVRFENYKKFKDKDGKSVTTDRSGPFTLNITDNGLNINIVDIPVVDVSSTSESFSLNGGMIDSNTKTVSTPSGIDVVFKLNPVTLGATASSVNVEGGVTFKKGNADAKEINPGKTTLVFTDKDGKSLLSENLNLVPGSSFNFDQEYTFSYPITMEKAKAPYTLKISQEAPVASAEFQITSEGTVQVSSTTDEENPEDQNSNESTTPIAKALNLLHNPLRDGLDSIPLIIAALVKNIVVPIAIPFLALAIMYTGFLFIQARGKPDELTKAKEALKWTLIGGAILLGAYVIATALQGTIADIIK